MVPRHQKHTPCTSFPEHNPGRRGRGTTLLLLLGAGEVDHTPTLRIPASLKVIQNLI